MYGQVMCLRRLFAASVTLLLVAACVAADDEQGPGEYEGPTLVNGTADGTIFVYDAGLRRLTAYSAAGDAIDTWMVDDESCCAWRMSVAPDGTL